MSRDFVWSLIFVPISFMARVAVDYYCPTAAAAAAAARRRSTKH